MSNQNTLLTTVAEPIHHCAEGLSVAGFFGSMIGVGVTYIDVVGNVGISVLTGGHQFIDKVGETAAAGTGISFAALIGSGLVLRATDRIRGQS